MRFGARTPHDSERFFEMAEKALAKNPHLASALLTMGHLHRLRAHSARTLDERAEAERRAKTELDAALRENPRIMRERDDARGEAAR